MNQAFKIKAKSCTLLSAPTSEDSLLSPGLVLEIPVFQRPYSWSDEQVEKLLNDILSTFNNPESPFASEPLFIGTMQLGKPKGGNIQEIIDGQQRLTTILLTLKVLKLINPVDKNLMELSLDWVKSRVSNGQQQKKLEAVMDLNNLVQLHKNTEIADSTNTYEKNARLICDILKTYFEEQEHATAKADALVNYLLHNLYFVVIETHAGLSKTLQIFDAINTTGLDLNGGDIFKIRMYEYLTSKKGQKDEVFEKISSLYEKIETYNAEIQEEFTSMQEILGIYQYYLIGHHELRKDLYSYSASRFFEELFDSLFGISRDGHFIRHLEKIDLNLETIDAIIESRYDWEKNWWSKAYFTEADVCMSHLFWGSRYSTYWRLIVLFNTQLTKEIVKEGDRWRRVLDFSNNMSRLYFSYSIIYARAINDVHRATYTLNQLICQGQVDELKKELLKLRQKDWLKEKVGEKLSGEITSNAKAKYLICRLAAMLEEDYTSKAQIIADYRTRLEGLLFNPTYQLDIEHIESVNHEDNTKREDIWQEWGNDMNSIGNLIVLERDINRNIKNKSFKKIQRHSYTEKSKFACVRNIGAMTDWTLADCQSRMKKQTTTIVNFLFLKN